MNRIIYKEFEDYMLFVVRDKNNFYLTELFDKKTKNVIKNLKNNAKLKVNNDLESCYLSLNDNQNNIINLKICELDIKNMDGIVKHMVEKLFL